MKDYGYFKLHGKNIHVTSEDDVDPQEIFATLLGMKVGELMDSDYKSPIKEGSDS